MLSKNQFISMHPELKEGMVVYDRNNNKLGKITELQDDHFIVHKGIFSQKNISLPYDEIVDVTDEDVTINSSPTA